MWNLVLYNEISNTQWVSVKMNDTSTGTLGKLINLLDLIASADQPLRFMDVVKASKQPRATVHRQLAHLMAEGLIEQTVDQTYVPGIRLLGFASKAWARSDLRSLAAPFLQQLNNETGEAVHLAVLRDSEVIYLDKLDARQTVRMHSQIGNRSPAYCTGVGKAALSLLSNSEISARFEGASFQAFTPHTITQLNHLIDDVELIRNRGYAYDLEEHEEGIRCIAVPITILANRQVAALSVTGPAYRVDEALLSTWAPMVKAAAKAISQRISVATSPS